MKGPKFESKKTNRTSERRAVIGGDLVNIIVDGKREEGERRVYVKLDKLNKPISEEIKERFYEGKWVKEKDYLLTKDLIPETEFTVPKESDKKDSFDMESFVSFSNDDLEKNRLDRESVQNVFSKEKFNKTRDELRIYHPAKFQNYIIRKKVSAGLLSLEERFKIRKEADSEVNNYILDLEADPIRMNLYMKEKKTKRIFSPGEYLSILKAGIEAAYIYAENFSKERLNVKQEDLGWQEMCTNDNLDMKYDIDYIQTKMEDTVNTLDKICFVQIKSNKKDAERDFDEIIRSQQEYLNTVLVAKEKLKEEYEKYTEELIKKAAGLEVKSFPKNILFANKFLAQVVFVDRKSGKSESIENKAGRYQTFTGEDGGHYVSLDFKL